MVKDKNNPWTEQQITVFLATPLSPLGAKEENSSHVFIVQAEVIEQVGSGLLLAISATFDQEHRPTELKAKKIFLPFSKVDYISIP